MFLRHSHNNMKMKNNFPALTNDIKKLSHHNKYQLKREDFLPAKIQQENYYEALSDNDEDAEYENQPTTFQHIRQQVSDSRKNTLKNVREKKKTR